MRKQILLAACLAALALIAGVFYAARTVLSHSFASIEADEARQSTERVRQALQADLHQLDVAAEDNALWDDLYEFVQGGRPDFLDQDGTRHFDSDARQHGFRRVSHDAGERRLRASYCGSESDEGSDEGNCGRPMSHSGPLLRQRMEAAASAGSRMSLVYTLMKTCGQSESAYAEFVPHADHRNLDVD